MMYQMLSVSALYLCSHYRQTAAKGVQPYMQKTEDAE